MHTVKRSQASRSVAGFWTAVLAGVGWTWAVTLLAARDHLVLNYGVIAFSPPAWAIVTLPLATLLLAAGAGAALAVGVGYVGRTAGHACPKPTRWLLAAYAIPVLDLLRLAGLEIPLTYAEPLGLALITGMVAGEIGRHVIASGKLRQWTDRVPWLAVVWILAVGAGGWWYYQGQQAYHDYMLGYYDFGQCGIRIVNTWEGRGFLMETPSLPAFYDHFNPGLVLLVPLWGLWPDPRLFVLIQAVCLAVPAPMVWGIARRYGATPAAAAAWAAAYLVFPATGQLNLSYSYGWHPVSQALPLLFASLWALARGWPVAACATALLACTFKENVPVIVACVALAMALRAWMDGRQPRGQPRKGTAGEPSTTLLANRLPIWVWLATAVVCMIGFVLIGKLAPFSRFQISKFAYLGDSTGQIILSPFTCPGVFWGEVLRARSAIFLLALTIPLGWRSLAGGWSALVALVVPVGVLLAWNLPAATSIAFQYTTTLIPVLFWAAIAGAATGSDTTDTPAKSSGATSRGASLCVSGIVALAAGATASAAFGALPWSGSTLSIMTWRTYHDGQDLVADQRAVGSPGNAMLNQIVTQVGGRESSVLASGRIAAHLLGVRRLEAVGQVENRWKALQEEAGPGRSAIEVFDWIVLDTVEQYQQSVEQLEFVAEQAQLAGYLLVRAEHRIVVYARPNSPVDNANQIDQEGL